MTILTIEDLVRADAPEGTVNFFNNYGLMGYPIARVNEIRGDYKSHISILKGLIDLREFDPVIVEAVAADTVFMHEYYDDSNTHIKRSIKKKHGNTVYEKLFNRSGQIIHEKFRYGSVDEITLELPVIEEWEYTYDDHGNRIIHHNTTTGKIIKYEFNELNKRVRRIVNNVIETIFKYDADGHLIEEYDPIEDTRYWSVYDANGNLTASSSALSYIWEYNEFGDITREIAFDGSEYNTFEYVHKPDLGFYIFKNDVEVLMVPTF